MPVSVSPERVAVLKIAYVVGVYLAFGVVTGMKTDGRVLDGFDEDVPGKKRIESSLERIGAQGGRGDR